VTRALVVLLGTLAVAGGCAAHDDPDIDAAAAYEGSPIYWLTEEFEGHELEHIGGLEEDATAIVLVYGTCDHGGSLNGGCAPPLQLQIFPLCHHLDVVTRNPIWRTREVRGGPVGHIDGAPVLFTRTKQVKVYRGQGSDRGMPMRALDLLHSLNDVEPFIPALGPIPPPAEGVLDGEVACSE
jgi:hypothetical protein